MESDSRVRASIDLAFDTLAEWHILRGRPEVDILSPPGQNAPPAVKAAWKTISTLSAVAWSLDGPRMSAAEAANRILLCFPARELEILRLRAFADRPVTLEDLGRRFAITRERARQLETRAISELRANPDFRYLNTLARDALHLEQLVAPLSEVLGETPALTGWVQSVCQPLWRVLDRLDDSFEISGDWWCRDSVLSASERTRFELKVAAQDRRAVRIYDVPLFEDSQWALDWVRSCGVPVHEGHALLVSSGIPDRAAVSLEVEGTPLSSEEIALRIGADRAISSVRNALAVDDRFVRVDRNLWALVVWGLGAYQSIRGLIAQEIETQGGAVRLSRLVSSITERFSVSPTSVIAYASSLPFTTVDGLVDLATPRATAVRKSPFDTKRLFRHPNGWVLRFAISADHERGSGSPLPSALISTLGLKFGEPKFLPGRYGDQRVAWSSSQATLGSIKRIVDGDELKAGDTCLAMFGDDGTFDIQQVSVTDVVGLKRAFQLAGLRPPQEETRSEGLAIAIGLPAFSSRQQIAEKLRMRGDYDIADCMLVGTRL